MIDFFLIIIFCTLGVLTGIITGLLPGLHVNNVSLILVILSGSILSWFSFLYEYNVSEQFLLLLLSIYVVGMATSHTFLDTIPTTFLGAPEADTALAVLPAHSLLLEGRGYEAVALSAMGSLGAIFFCFLLILPVRFVIGSPLFFYSSLREIMPWILIAISVIMIATEKAKIDFFNKKGKISYINGMAFATFVFFISGIFGLIIFELQADSPIGLSSTVLFPALAGLFGMPTLLTSLITKPTIPQQKIEEPNLKGKTKKSTIASIITGSFAGILVSIIPGITSATGTVLSMTVRGESDRRQTIITLSSVNTACAFFVVMVLFTILRSRSGATLAIMNLIDIDEWTSILMPTNLSYLLMALLLSGVLSYFFTLWIGKIFAKNFTKIPYVPLVKTTIALISFLVFLFTGIIGLLILIIATLIGLLPVQWGVRRSHCMGVLLIPIILYFL